MCGGGGGGVVANLRITEVESNQNLILPPWVPKSISDRDYPNNNEKLKKKNHEVWPFCNKTDHGITMIPA